MTHYNNELPPDFDETERAARCKDQAQAMFTEMEFKEFEVTNIRHVLHEHDAAEVKYIARALVGDGNHVMCAFTWDKASGSVTVSGCKATDRDAALEWF